MMKIRLLAIILVLGGAFLIFITAWIRTEISQGSKIVALCLRVIGSVWFQIGSQYLD